MEDHLTQLLHLLSEKDGVNYLDKNLNPANVPLAVIPLLKCKSQKGAVEHLLHDMIHDYHPNYNHEQYDKIFTVAIDYLDALETSDKKNKLGSKISNLRENAFNHTAKIECSQDNKPR